MTIASASDLIRANEGLRLVAYDDETGLPVGIGGACKGTLTIGYGHTGEDVTTGLVITTARAGELLAKDLYQATMRAALDLGSVSWAGLDPVRRAALTDMAFELGGKGLAGFHKMLAALRSGDWQGAHDECLASEIPRTRAERNATMFLTGKWPQTV